jgi:hypothetical protein
MGNTLTKEQAYTRTKEQAFLEDFKTESAPNANKKVVRSQEEILKLKAEQSKEFKEAKRKGMTKLIVQASIVPIGLYAFSKYKGYDGKKTAKVTIIGSVIILGAVVINGFSGAFSGNTISERLLASIGIGKKNKTLSDKQLMTQQNTPKQPVQIQK